LTKPTNILLKSRVKAEVCFDIKNYILGVSWFRLEEAGPYCMPEMGGWLRKNPSMLRNGSKNNIIKLKFDVPNCEIKNAA
jgi:hypothetical protein